MLRKALATFLFFFFLSKYLGSLPANCISLHALGPVDYPQITDYREVSKERGELGPRTSFQNANAIHYSL